MVEGSTELVQLFLSDSLAVPGEDLVLHLVDCPETQTRSSGRVWLGSLAVWLGAKRGGWSGLLFILSLSAGLGWARI